MTVGHSIRNHVLSFTMAVVLMGAAMAHAAPDAALRAASERAARSVGAPIAVSEKRGTARASFVRRVDRGNLNPGARGRTARETAQDFVVRHGDLFGLGDPTTQLAPPTERVDAHGWTHVTWQ